MFIGRVMENNTALSIWLSMSTLFDVGIESGEAYFYYISQVTNSDWNILVNVWYFICESRNRTQDQT